MSKPRRPNRELVVKKEYEVPELLRAVSAYLDKTRNQMSNAFEHLHTWDAYLRGHQAGILVGLDVAVDLVDTACSRVMAAETPFPSEPYSLDG